VRTPPSPSEAALRALVVVPARLASTRLPRKMLLRETGRYLFQHTVENVAACPAVSRVVLATDAEEIRAAAAEVGIEALLTSAHHPSGTDRVQEAVEILARAGHGPWDVVLNVQGDEPELPRADLEHLIEAFREADVELATLAAPITDEREASDPSVVKVVLDGRGNALYFSRSPIPARHDDVGDAGRWPGGERRRHVGVYAFRPAALARFTQLPRGALERSESLEQLRWLEAGHSIRVLEAGGRTVGIDTRDDYALFVEQRKRTTRPDPLLGEKTP